jgi:hypothetical protein
MKNVFKYFDAYGFRTRLSLPLPVKIINTAVAAVLLYFSIYHFPRPDAAWRSGVTELSCAVMLLSAAYLVPYLISILLNLIVAGGMLGLGIRHLSHGHGYRSGLTEIACSILLIVAIVIICRKTRK